MFINNINPTLLQIGPFEIRYYGLIYALGFVIAIIFMRYFATKGLIKLSNKNIDDLIFWLIIGVVGGARLFEVLIWEPKYYFSNPSQIFAVWHGGLSFHGAVIGGSLAIYYFAKKNNLKVLKLLDLLVIPATLAVALGRIGNFTNSEIYGPVTDVPWCVVFERTGDTQCRHPYQIYSFLKRILLFGYLFYLNTKKHKDGFIFWNFIFFFGIGRFLLDFVRVDTIYGGLSTGQWLSVFMILIGGYVLLKNYIKVKL